MHLRQCVHYSAARRRRPRWPPRAPACRVPRATQDMDAIMAANCAPECTCSNSGPFRRFRMLSTQLRQQPQPPTAAPHLAAAELACTGAGGRWAKWRALEARIAKGEVILMDGGTGTEVEKRVKCKGDPTAVNVTGWSCAQALLHPDVCEEVHGEYFGLGSEVVITNTYASNRMILDTAGYGDRIEEVHEKALGAAMAARAAAAASDDALVVGSGLGRIVALQIANHTSTAHASILDQIR